MAHNLEIVDGVAQIAYAGETPWHGLGTKVPPDLTPAQMCKAAGLDWKVEKRQNKNTLNGKEIIDQSGILVRLPNGTSVKKESILTRMPNASAWHEYQNEQAFDFFNDFIAAGDMEMHTAGSLADGELMWVLARVKESFYVVKKKDEVQSYLLFTNPHRFGMSIDTRFTPTRVVCNNTLSLALNTASAQKVSSTHRSPFNADMVKEKLGLASYKMTEYKERAQFLATKQYKNEDIVEYFKRLFPAPTPKKEEEQKRKTPEFSRAANYSMAVLNTQPGADIAPGTFWNLYNAATYYTNHLAGKSDSSRVESLWYGGSQKKNVEALNLAVEMANAA